MVFQGISTWGKVFVLNPVSGSFSLGAELVALPKKEKKFFPRGGSTSREGFGEKTLLGGGYLSMGGGGFETLQLRGGALSPFCGGTPANYHNSGGGLNPVVNDTAQQVT